VDQNETKIITRMIVFTSKAIQTLIWVLFEWRYLVMWIPHYWALPISFAGNVELPALWQ